MKISKLIEKLERLKNKHGDLEIIYDLGRFNTAKYVKTSVNFSIKNPKTKPAVELSFKVDDNVKGY